MTLRVGYLIPSPGLSLREISRRWIRFTRRFRPDPRRTAAYSKIAGLFEDYLHATEAVARKLLTEGICDKASSATAWRRVG